MSSSAVAGSAADPDAAAALIRLQKRGRSPGCPLFYFLNRAETNTSSGGWRAAVVEA